MEKNKIAKNNFVGWMKDQWAHSPIFSTLLALVVMVLVQSVVMTNLAGSFMGMFGKMGIAWLNILRNNTYAGIIALGMCFVIISGGIDLLDLAHTVDGETHPGILSVTRDLSKFLR